MRDDLTHFQIEQAIFEVVRADGLIGAGNFQLEARLGPGHFVTHGLESVVIILLGLGARRHSATNHGKKQTCACNPQKVPHCWPPALTTSCAGGGRMGGRSVELSFFCTSSSEVKIAGEAAETGTEPDSAPQ